MKTLDKATIKKACERHEMKYIGTDFSRNCGKTAWGDELKSWSTELMNVDFTPSPMYEYDVQTIPEIKKVILNGPATIIIWNDGTKTIVKCTNSEPYDAEKGIAMAIVQRLVFGKVIEENESKCG